MALDNEKYIRSVVEAIGPYKSFPPISNRITNALLEIEISTIRTFLEFILECGDWRELRRFRRIGKKSIVQISLWAFGMGYMSKREFDSIMTYIGKVPYSTIEFHKYYESIQAHTLI